ncbi:hypothetical protein DOE76_08765 [Leifsonia sp. ku-ls]|nr:hypothetical protein DOE76_08765 [Leifsonia sp. ku-ls]
MLCQLERGFLEIALGYYATPSRYPLIAAELIAAGGEDSRLAELAGLSRNAPESEICELLDAIGRDFGWSPKSRSSGVRRLFALWACAVGEEISAAEFAQRSRIHEVRANLALPSYEWVAWLVGLESEWTEMSRPREDVESDILILAQELCYQASGPSESNCDDLV